MAALSFGGLPLDFQVCLPVHSNSSHAKSWHCSLPSPSQLAQSLHLPLRVRICLQYIPRCQASCFYCR